MIGRLGMEFDTHFILRTVFLFPCSSESFLTPTLNNLPPLTQNVFLMLRIIELWDQEASICAKDYDMFLQ